MRSRSLDGLAQLVGVYGAYVNRGGATVYRVHDGIGHDRCKTFNAVRREMRERPVELVTEGGWLRKPDVGRRHFNRAETPEIRYHAHPYTDASLVLLAEVNVKVVSERRGPRLGELHLGHLQHVPPTMQKGWPRRWAARRPTAVPHELGCELATKVDAQTSQETIASP